MTMYERMNTLVQDGTPFVVCTITSNHGSTPRRIGSKMLVFADGKITGSIGGGEMESRVIAEALDALAEEKPRTLAYDMVDPTRGDPGLCGGNVEIFIEPILPTPLVVVAGGGHVGRAIVSLSKWLGFRVALTDDRPEYCTPESAPDADHYFPDVLSALPNSIAIHSQTYIFLTTRNIAIDVEALPALLATPAAYVGIIGSRRRWATTRGKLAKAGLSDEQLDRVVSPIGLELNAETPEEIALSVLAEIVMLRNGGTGDRMGVGMQVKGTG